MCQHYTALGLPIDGDAHLTQLEQRLHTVTASVDGRVPQNPALTIDRDKAEFHLVRLKASPEQAAAATVKDLLESRIDRRAAAGAGPQHAQHVRGGRLRVGARILSRLAERLRCPLPASWITGTR